MNWQKHQTKVIVARVKVYYNSNVPVFNLQVQAPFDPGKRLGSRHQPQKRGVLVLYESTKTLLQSILSVLETGDESRWDDQTESANACLYEMHQMSGPLYKAYRTDTLNRNSVAQISLPEKLNRAMPHVRLMVIAIRRRDRAKALESGKAALAEMNGTGFLPPPGHGPAPKTESRQTSNVSRHKGKPAGRQRPMSASAGR